MQANPTRWHFTSLLLTAVIAFSANLPAAEATQPGKADFAAVQFPLDFQPSQKILRHQYYMGFRHSRYAQLPQQHGTHPLYVVRIAENILEGNPIVPGDILLAINHQPLSSDAVHQFRNIIYAARRARHTVSITRWRHGKITTLSFAPWPTAPDLVAQYKKTHNHDWQLGDTGAHDWTLGATGARGWIWAAQHTTKDARQILITKVNPGSPADGILKVNDVILGINGKPFTSDARIAFANALTQAETKAGGGRLSLVRFRDGDTKNVTVHIQVMGTYSPTAPYDDAKSRLIVKQGCEAIAKEIAGKNYKTRDANNHIIEGRINPITRCLNAMALLGSGNPKYLPLVKKEAQWASQFSASSFQTWWYGYCMMFLSEYIDTTGDQSVMPGLRRLALAAANGQSIVGSWGHRFAGPDGRCQGYGMMNAAGLPLTIGLVEARMVGVKDPVVKRAIDRSAKLFRFYIHKGSIPYGDHAPWMNDHSSNGKNGMAALLFDLLGNKSGATFFSKMCTAGYGAERDGGHTGNFFNLLWAMPGIALSGPHVTGAWMKTYGHWYFDLARRWNGTFLFQGEPEAWHKYENWDSTGAYVLAYEMPLHKLWFTGKRPPIVPQLTADQAHQIIVDGRGSGNVRKYYDHFSQAQLLKRLSSWSPIVRQRAAEALGRLENPPVDKLLNLLDATDLHTRLGACVALAQCNEKAAPAVPALRKTLDANRMWLRVQAATALADIGKPAMPALPKMLQMIARGPTATDPRNMQQRFLCFAVFGQMLKHSLDDVDPKLLRQAIAAGLQNQDGRARGDVGSIYSQLSFDQIQPLLPAIRDAVAIPAPSGIMFADGIRIAGLKVLAKFHIRQGMQLCIDVMTPDKWGQGRRIPQCLDILTSYGSDAKPLLPQLRKQQDQFLHSKDRHDTKVQAALQNAIKTIENATTGPQLRSLTEATS